MSSLKSSLLLALAFAAAAGMSSGDIARVRELGYLQRYDSALAITSAAIQAEPTDPAGYYWHGVVPGEPPGGDPLLAGKGAGLGRARIRRDPAGLLAGRI